MTGKAGDVAPRRFFISVDHEGIGAVTSWDSEGMPGGSDYERMREWMTGEAVAAVDGALAAGVQEVIVADSHGNARNLIPDRFPDPVQLIRSWPRPHGMAQGVEMPGIIGAAFIGYHSPESSFSGTMRHTHSSRNYFDLRINGESVSETTISAAIAGHFGVPVILVSGDNEYVAHARALLPDVKTVTTKQSLGLTTVQTRTPGWCQAEIRKAVQSAIAGAGQHKPFRLEGPLTFEIDFKQADKAEILSYLPGVERISSHGVLTRFPDILELKKFIEFLGSYSAD